MEEKTKSKARVFWYAVIIDQSSRFEQVLEGGTKAELKRKIEDLRLDYESKELDQFVINCIIKGKKVIFKPVTKLEF